MPTFYFDVEEDELFRDEEGCEFDDLHVACIEAHRALAEIAAGYPTEKNVRHIRMNVRDQRGDHVITAELLLSVQVKTSY